MSQIVNVDKEKSLFTIEQIKYVNKAYIIPTTRPFIIPFFISLNAMKIPKKILNILITIFKAITPFSPIDENMIITASIAIKTALNIKEYIDAKITSK